VGIVLEALHKLLRVLVDVSVDADEVVPIGELGGAGKLTVEEKVGGLEIGTLFGECSMG
jgi:hypothetical protein